MTAFTSSVQSSPHSAWITSAFYPAVPETVPVTLSLSLSLSLSFPPSCCSPVCVLICISADSVHLRPVIRCIVLYIYIYISINQSIYIYIYISRISLGVMAKVGEGKGERSATLDSWSPLAEEAPAEKGDAASEAAGPVDRCLTAVRNTRNRAASSWQRNKIALTQAFS